LVFQYNTKRRQHPPCAQLAGKGKILNDLLDLHFSKVSLKFKGAKLIERSFRIQQQEFRKTCFTIIAPWKSVNNSIPSDDIRVSQVHLSASCPQFLLFRFSQDTKDSVLSCRELLLSLFLLATEL
jgi:hypothetical protein